MQYTCWDISSPAQNRFCTHRFWYLLLFLQFFVSSLLHQQNISLWGLLSFMGRNKQKVGQGKIGRIGRVGHEGHVTFGQKLRNTQQGVGRCIMKWQMHWKSLQNNIHGSLMQPLKKRLLMYWYRWALERSPSRGSLYYKGSSLPCLFGSLLVYVVFLSWVIILSLNQLSISI